VDAQLASRGLVIGADQAELQQRRCALFKDRCATVVELADWIEMYFVPVRAPADELAPHLTAAVGSALEALSLRLEAAEWSKAGIALALKETLAEQGLKMPQLALPLRLLLCGRAQTPSIDAVLALFPREIVLDRLRQM
jgi:glutamyl-tRNA synthetase